MVCLAKSAIDSVKDAELRAEKVKEAATKKAELLIETAQMNADQYDKAVMKEARAKHKLILGIAESQGKKRMKDYLLAANEDKRKLAELVEKRKKEVIKLILEQVI